MRSQYCRPCSSRAMANVRIKYLTLLAAKGLPPIDRNPAPARKDASATSSSSASKGVLSVAAPKTGKRKAVAVGSDGPASKDGAPTDKKKQKKEKKGLLSFDEEG